MKPVQPAPFPDEISPIQPDEVPPNVEHPTDAPALTVDEQAVCDTATD